MVGRVQSSRNVDILFLDEGSFKKLIGKGWRNSVMQRRIYGRLTKSAKKEAEDWARQTKRTLGISKKYFLYILETFAKSNGDDQAEEAYLDLKTKETKK